jgi:hypothetical protein
MIGQSVKLTTFRGVEVGVYYSWFIIFVLIICFRAWGCSVHVCLRCAEPECAVTL